MIWVRDQAHLIERDGDTHWIGVLTDITSKPETLIATRRELERSRRSITTLLEGITRRAARSWPSPAPPA